MDLKKIDLSELQDYIFSANEIAISRVALQNSKFINIKCLDNEDIVPTVKAIPLDKLEQAREEIEQLKPNNPNFEHYIGETRALNQVLEILDGLISEVEEC